MRCVVAEIPNRALELRVLFVSAYFSLQFPAALDDPHPARLEWVLLYPDGPMPTSSPHSEDTIEYELYTSICPGPELRAELRKLLLQSPTEASRERKGSAPFIQLLSLSAFST